VLFVRFWIVFGAQNDPKNAPKALQARAAFSALFFVDFWAVWEASRR
jgi:hypothetical protein